MNRTVKVTLAVLLACAAVGYTQEMPTKVSVSTATAAGKTVKPTRMMKKTPAGKAKVAAKVVDYKVTQKEYGIKTVCPVTKEEVTVDSTTTAAKYDGKIYYFCCPGCIDQFKAAPQKYAVK